MSEILYTRGSADAGYGYRNPIYEKALGDRGSFGASQLQKFLEDFADTSLIGQGVSRGIDAVINAFTKIDSATVDDYPGYQAAAATAAALRSGADPETARAAGEEQRAKTEAEQAEGERQTGLKPGLLSAGLGVAEEGYSRFISRPSGTLMLATDPDSPVYDDGVSPGDLRTMYDRTEVVPFGRTLAANPMNLSSRLMGFDNYDVWSDTDMQAADLNPFYNFYTGSADFGLQFVPLAARPVRLSLLSKAGVKRGLTDADFKQMRDEYVQHRNNKESAPAGNVNNPRYQELLREEGRLRDEQQYVLRTEPLRHLHPRYKDLQRQLDEVRAEMDAATVPTTVVDAAAPSSQATGIGFLVDQTAQETDPQKIFDSPILSGVSGVDKVKLADIYARTDDPDTVFNLYMAAKGDFQALNELATTAPQHIWDLAEMNSAIYNDAINGQPFTPEGEDLVRVQQIFDSAADRDRYFFDVKRTLVTQDGTPRMSDTRMAGKLWVEKVRDAAGRVKYSFKTQDYSGAPRWVQAVTDGPIGTPATQFIAWVGSRQPKGRVSRSGARPNDLVDELDSWWKTVPLFRGNKTVTVGIDADGNRVTMPAEQYVREQKARLLNAQVQGGLEGAWRQMEDEAIVVMGLTIGYNLADARDLVRLADELRGEAKKVDDYLEATGGYVYSERGEQIVFEPMTTSMLLDSFSTTPLDEILYLARQNRLGANPVAKTLRPVPGVARNVFDQLAKYFRTNVLMRLGYIPKNSIGEPFIASTIVHGTILTDEGLPSTLANFTANRANQFRRAAYLMELSTRIKKAFGNKDAKTRKQLRYELLNLVAQREEALEVIDLLQADLDAIKMGQVAPSLSPRQALRARATMFEAHKIIRSIEATLDEQIPEWRQVVEPATPARVAERLRFYRAVLGEDPEYLNDLRDELGGILSRSYENTTLPTQAVQDQIDRLQAELDRIDQDLERYSMRFDIPNTDVSDVSVTGAGAQRNIPRPNPGRVEDDAILKGNTARGRDLSAIAMQRQRTSLVEQIDALRLEKRRMEETGVDAFADFRMSVSDRARAELLQAEIARLEALQARVKKGKGRQRLVADVRSAIEDLEAKYAAYIDNIDREVDVSVEKRDEMIRDLEEIEERIRATQEELGIKQAKIDEVSGDSALRGSGRGDMTFNINGERYTVPGPLSDTQYNMGAGWRAEVDAMQTARLNYDPSFKAGVLTQRVKDAGEVEVIDRYNFKYFDELAYVGNTYFRDDELIGQILTGISKADAIKWLRTPEGRQYQAALGKDYLTPKQTVSDPVRATNGETTVRVLLDEARTIDEVFDIVYRYFPTEQSRKALAEGRLSGSQLASMLAREEELSRIISARGLWELSGEGKGSIKEMGSMFNRVLDRLWKYAMGIPETRLARNPFFTREFRKQMDMRIEAVRSQAEARGTVMTVDEWNRQLEAIRQSARRDALTVMEKTFYNIRRYSSPVYAARYLTAFPGATANSLYRYGRFALTEPERMITGSLVLSDALQIIGVDADGNPVDDDSIGEAVYLLIPGTKRDKDDLGMRIPVASLSSMFVDMPMLSYLSAASVSAIARMNPKNDERLRDAFKSVGLDWYYQDLFPFGPEKNPLATLFAGYQKDIWRGIRGPSDTDFIMTAAQFYTDSMAKWEQSGYEGEAPTFDSAVSDARAYYVAGHLDIGPVKIPIPNIKSRAVTKFSSPLSVFTSGPGQMWRDRWYAHREKYPNDTQEARRTFMDKHGDWARWYTYSSSEYTAYLPSSIDVYERIFEKYPHLVKEMVSVAGDDAINYVSLLALDADQTFTPAVNNAFRNKPLPGDDVPIISRINPERVANIVRVNDGWDLYNREVLKHNAEQTRLRELRNNAESTEMADFYRDEMFREEQAWKQFLREGPLGQNEAWNISKTKGGSDAAQRAAIFLRMIVTDKEFSKDEGQTEYWKNVEKFLDMRDEARLMYDRIRSNEDKQQFKTDWRNQSMPMFLEDFPDFLPVYERFFAKEWE